MKGLPVPDPHPSHRDFSPSGAPHTGMDGRAQALRADMEKLARSVDLFQRALHRPDRMPLRFRPAGFGALVRLILEQQVSVRAAEAMWARLMTELGTVTPDAFLTLDGDRLRLCGFSARKAAYARDLAMTIRDGALDLDTLATLPDDEAVATLTRLRGIGHWTAACYLLWSLGRRDIMPAGDLALQVGYKELAGMADRPDAAALNEAAQDWRPYRSAAAFLLWRVYLDNRSTDGSSATADESKTSLQPSSTPLLGHPI